MPNIAIFCWHEPLFSMPEITLQHQEASRRACGQVGGWGERLWGPERYFIHPHQVLALPGVSPSSPHPFPPVGSSLMARVGVGGEDTTNFRLFKPCTSQSIIHISPEGWG